MDVIGLPWIRKAHYEPLLKLFEDRDQFPPTYEEWVQEADAFRLHLEGRGIRVIRAYIDPLEFTEWCFVKNVRIDADARLNFANWIAANGTLNPF